MAKLEFSITVPDEQVQRVATALRYAFNQPNATIPELVELVRQDALAKVKGMVRNYEEIQARKAAENDPPPIDAI
jgi:hypothetical protein